MDFPPQAIPKPWRRHVLGQDGKMEDARIYVFTITDSG